MIFKCQMRLENVPVPVLTPETQNVRRKMAKWNRRETEWIPAASGCGQMLGEGSGRKENGRKESEVCN